MWKYAQIAIPISREGRSLLIQQVGSNGSARNMVSKTQRKKANRILQMMASPLQVGGQAVIEGVMIKSPSRVVTSVRKHTGQIVSRVEPYVSLSNRFRVLGLPIIRGVVNLVEQIYLGVKSLSFSAEVASTDDDLTKRSSGLKTSFTTGATLVVAFVIALGLFFYLPLFVASAVGAEGSIGFNIIDGLVRLAIFFLYLAVVGLWKDMRRVFEYHGAEHKSIHAYENGDILEAQSVKKYTTRHARCGTSFLLVVMVVSLVVFIFMGRPHNIHQRLARLAAVPFIAGISYEVVRLAGRRQNSRLTRILSAPGLMLQSFTTREPSLDQIEVAIDALKKAIGGEVTC